ncbi:MAG: cadherin-like domain-containing protein [Planctomycetes bacterium]|nr:cadherin-like domain-containing protein [Planctomycetota bacterium]
MVAANTAPTANDDTADAFEDGPAVTIDVLANDSDPDASDVLSVSAVGACSSGGVLTNNTADVSYDPNGAFEYLAVGETATDTCSYDISDGNGGSDTGSIEVTIHGQNDAPTANDDTADAFEDGPAVTIDVLANDSDPDASDVLSVSAVGACSNGGVLTNNSTDVSYDPNGAFEYLAVGEMATDTCSYDIGDGNGGSDTGSIEVTIHGQNDAPSVTLSGDSSADEGQSKTYTYTASDVDLTDVLTATPDCGAEATMSDDTFDGTNGSFTCTFVEGPGSSTVSVSVDDGNDGMDSDSIDVTVANVAPTAALANDSPKPAGIAVNITFSGQFDPSTADTAAGLRYSYDCGGGTLGGGGAVLTTLYASSNSSSAVTCTYATAGTYTVTGRIIDKDGGYNTYTTTVFVSAKVTGGGSVDSGIRNFGFIVQQRPSGAFQGNLEFQDKTTGVNINFKSTSITSIVVGSGATNATISGMGKVNNGTATVSFTATVQDLGEPGAGVDTFRIVLGGSTTYSSPDLIGGGLGRLLTKGGNIQIHKAASSLVTADAAGSDGTGDDLEALVGSAGQVLIGVLNVSLDTASLSADQLDGIRGGLTSLGEALATFGVTLVEDDSGSGDMRINVASTSPCGSAADGVLGCATDTGDLTIISGWNWYAGGDSSAIGSDEYDFQTIVTHEMGHGVGLGHSNDAASVMFASLARGVARRYLTAADIASIGLGSSENALHAEALLAADASPGALGLGTRVSFLLPVRAPAFLDLGAAFGTFRAAMTADELANDRAPGQFDGLGTARLSGAMIGHPDGMLIAGRPRDLLIGSMGADRLVGNAEEDILVAGRTSYDAFSVTHETALQGIMNEWVNGTGSNSARI